MVEKSSKPSYKSTTNLRYLFEYYMRPNEPAVNPTAQKKVNSRRSLGRELTINLNWVIWPCAPQVCKFLLS